MPIIKPAALAVLKNCDVSIKLGTGTANNYAPAVSNCTISPTTSSATFQGMGADSSYTDQSSSAWTAALTFAQDWDNADSLSNFLFTNEGKEATIDFRPRDKSAGFSVKTTLAPGSIGGEVNGFATSTVNFGVSGKPTRLAAITT